MLHILFFVFVALNVAHAYTKIQILSKISTEKAPALYHMFTAFGDPLIPLILVKTALCFVVYLFFRDNPIALSALNLLFFGGVLHNLMQMSRA